MKQIYHKLLGVCVLLYRIDILVLKEDNVGCVENSLPSSAT